MILSIGHKYNVTEIVALRRPAGNLAQLPIGRITSRFGFSDQIDILGWIGQLLLAPHIQAIGTGGHRNHILSPRLDFHCFGQFELTPTLISGDNLPCINLGTHQLSRLIVPEADIMGTLLIERGIYAHGTE